MTYTAPGVYVEEDTRTPMPLAGVATGVPCFFGFTQQGPYLKPTRITSPTEFSAIFGPRVRRAGQATRRGKDRALRRGSQRSGS